MQTLSDALAATKIGAAFFVTHHAPTVMI